MMETLEANPRPMRRVVESVLRDLDNGEILSYYLKERWEAPLRNDFAEMVGAYASSHSERETHNGILRRLNYGYRTRYGLGALYDFGDVVADLVEKHGWWQRRPPTLFGSSDADAETLAAVPSAVISTMAAKKLPRPYSLSTKCLHFLFPDSFAICDQQAAASIQMWAYFAFPTRGESWKRFSWACIANMSGGGYDGVICFYRLFWTTATKTEREAITAGAKKISETIGGYVSTVDVVDKLLWRENGDPIVLGFCIE